MKFYSSSSKYNVFLSFNREDTGNTFVSHLNRSLDRLGSQTYIDESQQTRDGRICPEVTQAIRESDTAVIVLSENYASSVWGLNVLAEISESSCYIKTVFYEMDPNDLTRGTGKFADDFRRHEQREVPETVDRWRNALQRLESSQHRFCSRNWEDDSKMLDFLVKSITFPSSSMAEFEVGGYQRPVDLDLASYPIIMSQSYSARIPKIKSLSEPGETALESDVHQDTFPTDDMPNESPYPVPDDSNGLVGMYRHKKAVYALLDLGSKNNVRAVGIWGTQGVGKTTLAECIFEEISRHFQHHCFLTNVSNIYQNRVSPSLLKHLTRSSRSDDSFDAIKPNLVNRKVLLVVDGVDAKHNQQFKDVINITRWLGPGSRVVMTSRDKNLLASCNVNYKMECLRYEEALQLFSLFAFKKAYPLIGFEGLSVRAAHLAGRLPLAIKVLGSFLYEKDEESWKKTLRKLEATEDNGSRQISNYIGACEYLPRSPIGLEQYVRADEQGHSSAYHMLL